MFSKKRLFDAYRNFFLGSDDGKLVLHDLIRESGLLTGGKIPSDPHYLAFREGKRAMALRILQILQYDEKRIAEMVQEFNYYKTGDNQ